jgi:SSS family transporter
MRSILLIFFLLFSSFVGLINANDANQHKAWVNSETNGIPPLPVNQGLGGAFAGVHNDVMIVAGGSYFDKPLWEDGKKIYTDSIWVCIRQGNEKLWRYAGRLPYPIAHGASVSTDKGILCVGGKTDDEIFSNVWLLEWDHLNKKVVINTDFPQLPEACAYLSAALMDNHIYVAGGIGIDYLDNFRKLELKNKEGKWENISGMPWGARSGATLVKQSNGENDCLYLFGGRNESQYFTDAYCFNYNRTNPDLSNWERLPDIPYPVFGPPAIPYGLSNIFLFSGSDGHDSDRILEIKDKYQFRTDVLSINTITKEWSVIGELPYGIVCTPAFYWDDKIVIPGGEIRPSVRTAQILTIKAKSVEKGNFHLIDYITLIAYLLLIVWLGYYFSKKNKSSKDFFLGGQKIPFWAAGLSMMAAQVSSIGFMSIPAKSFITNWSYFAGVLTWFIVVPIVIYAFVPFYRRLNVTSAYEYLEKRFNVFIRKFIAFLYLLFQLLGRLAAIIFLPAIALTAVTGIDPVICIVIIGGLATLYTVLGGMHAVIWIDVIQTIVMFGAIFLCVSYVLVSINGGLGEIYSVAMNNQKFSFGRMDWDMTAAVFWVIIIGNIFNRVGGMATDQSVVQRYLTTRNEKETAKALWTDALISIPWALCVFGLGTALYVFYKVNPDMLSPTISNDEIVPFFIGQNLPTGISGIVIAGIFATSMSSVDSSIHSSATVIMRDFMKGIMSRINEEQKVRYARIITTVLGLLGTGISIVMTFININSVWDIILEIAGLFTGAMTGVFILGIFSSKANGKGAIIGVLTSAAILLYVKTFTPLNFFLYSGIGIISCVITGYLASFMFKSTRSTRGLTIYTVGLKEEK